MNITISDYEDYLYDHYQHHGIDTSLFMKLVEEVGEVAEVRNKRDGRKASGSDDLNFQLAKELVDVIHYAVAIAALNRIDLSDVLLQKYIEDSRYLWESGLSEIRSTVIGSVIGTHAGPGAVAAAFFKK